MKEIKHKLVYQELLEIMSPNELQIFTGNVFCPECKNPKIVDFEDSIYVNDLFDVILEGKCDKCGKKIARYLETGEHDGNVEKLREILFQK